MFQENFLDPHLEHMYKMMALLRVVGIVRLLEYSKGIWSRGKR